MNKIIFTSLVVLFAFAGINMANADEDESRSSLVTGQAVPAIMKIDDDPEEPRQKKGILDRFRANKEDYKNAREDIREIRDEEDDEKEEFREEVRERQAEFKGDVEKAREEMREQINEERDDFAERLKNAETDEEREEIKAEAKERKNELREQASSTRKEFQEKHEEMKKELTERAKERVKAYTERIIVRLTAAYERLEQIGERLQTRLDKLSSDGVDTAKAQEYLDTATDKILIAREAVSDARTAIDEAVLSENPRETMDEVKALIKEAVDSVKDAHKSLVEAVRAAKAGKSPNEEHDDSENPTEEPETTSTNE